MKAKEAAKILVAMVIIRENCATSTCCDGCPFEYVCDAYLKDTGKTPADWEVDE